jgi:acyl-CoA hydrolase
MSKAKDKNIKPGSQTVTQVSSPAKVQGVSPAAAPRAASRSQVTMTELVLPQHTNGLGSIFGGVIMSWVDIAAAISAQRHSRMAVVTASIDGFQFVEPVYTGWVVNLKASVNFTGRTSMEVGVRVDAENPQTGEMFHTASAYLTFVALDQNKRPAPVAQVLAETEIEKRRFTAAKERRDARLKFRERIKP